MSFPLMAKKCLGAQPLPGLSQSRLALVLLALLLTSTAPAIYALAPTVSYVHTRYTVDDGLPTDGLTAAATTPDGYLWFGTQDGLVRYDGHRFFVFNTTNEEAFGENRITRIAVDLEGDLWIQAESTLYHYRAGLFTRRDQHPAFQGERVSAVLGTPEGIYVATQIGLYREHEGNFEAIVEGLWDDRIADLHRARDGSIWVGLLRSGAVRIQNGQVRSFTRWRGRPIRWAKAFFDRPGGGLWITTEIGICTFENGEEGKILPLERWSALAASWRLSESHHNLWLVPPRTLTTFDSTGSLQPLDLDRWSRREIPLAWGGDKVHAEVGGRTATRIGLIMAAARDHEGGIWLTTYQNGLHAFRPVPITAYGAEQGLVDQVHYAVAEGADGVIFAGGTTQLSRLDGRSFEPLLEHVSWWAYLARHREGEVWFAGIEDPPHRFTDAGFEPFRSPDLPQHPWFAWQGQDGTRWFGFGIEEGQLYGLRDGVWSRYGSEEGLSFAPHDLFEARDGALWLKNPTHGVLRFQNGRFVPFNTEHGLPSNDVRYIHEDRDGILWLAVYGFGLVRADLSAISNWHEDAFHQVRLTHYRQRDGLFDDAISSVLEDDHGRLWLSSNRGIFWVLKDELEAMAAGRAERFHVASYGVKDGMRHREANGATQAAALQASDGRLWFPTMDGVVAVDPNAVEHRPPPNVLFEQVRAGGAALPPKDRAVELEAAQRSFEVEFTTPVFAAPEQVVFRYRLAGYDDAWQETTRRRLTYTRVPGGRYTLQVQARGRSGLWSEATSELRLHVAPFFYETWWFRALAALVALLAVAGVIRLRLRHLRQRQLELEALIRERTADLETEKETVAAQAEQLTALDQAKSHLFANISHEFRTPLTLLIGPLEDSLADRHGSLPAPLRPVQEAMLRNSRRLLELVEQLLDLARFEAGEQKLAPTVCDLGELLRESVRSFTPLAERLGIELSCETAELPQLGLDREKLEKVLLNLISNACKFTPDGGRVEVRLEANDRQVEVTVRDTGPGISSEDLPHIFDRFYHSDERRQTVQPSTGLGLALARELTELHGGTLEVESSPGQGSTFTVRLPRSAVEVSGPVPTPSSGRATVAQEVPPDVAPAPTAPPLGNAIDQVPSDDREVANGPADSEDRPAVLVVDDNADVRRYVGSILRGQFRILEAGDGEEGLQAARAHCPDLIVSDVMMPKLDGHALARALKEDAMTEGIPILLLTARAATQDRVAGLETGVDGYLTKPFEGAVLEARARNLIALRHRLRDLYRQDGFRETKAPKDRVQSAFEQRVRAVIASRLAEDDLSVEALAKELFLSRSQLFRRLREEANATPTELIRTVKLEKAAQLLEDRAGNVTEVAYAVGFKSLSHFTRSFRRHFQLPPSAYLRASGSRPSI